MAVPRRESEEMIASRIASEEAAERERFWMNVGTLAICLLWSILGGAVTVAAFVVRDPELGGVLLSTGWMLAAAGNLLTVFLSRAWLARKGHG
jgi:hypothetical protein